jgi:hypothetical protein
MSTKSTIAHSENFHFYREALDYDNVYLEIEEVEFECSSNSVMVVIPVHIWEVIREYQGVSLLWADKTDEEIISHVSQDVENRIAQYAKASGAMKGWKGISGIFVYGSADEPKETQIEKGIAYYTKLRDKQQKVKAAIEELRQAQNR